MLVVTKRWVYKFEGLTARIPQKSTAYDVLHSSRPNYFDDFPNYKSLFRLEMSQLAMVDYWWLYPSYPRSMPLHTHYIYHHFWWLDHHFWNSKTMCMPVKSACFDGSIMLDHHFLMDHIWVNYSDLTVLLHWESWWIRGNHPLLWPQDSGEWLMLIYPESWPWVKTVVP